ncbi:FeoB-associated Cys-rich membrane protein [Marivirga lumbricoides]|uniref:FeoB-associated Cys-rich membrane protein n=1 Tax=Marivirga lumbricoides TaxID=1046115 RepID=A0A2T4DF23_9BACT|nr:hypothetical protein C9994_14105 [Marivirga lumbricoides]
MQEIIVFILFFSIIAYSIYRFFFMKKKPSGGCSKCAMNPEQSYSKSK